MWLLWVGGLIVVGGGFVAVIGRRTRDVSEALVEAGADGGA